jgi:23S rRNA (adenine2503-C2)-methyltransferase
LFDTMAKNAAGKVALSGLNLAQITDFVKELGLPAFRAKQIHSWIYAKYAASFDEMTDLSVELREKIKQVADVPLLTISDLEVSKDGTRKYLFSLPDGQIVESVLIAFEDRPTLSVCLSSQVGCAVGCTFCATGYLGFKRNLTAQEIVDQLMAIQRESGHRVSNIIYMGQGEPLLNTDNVIESIETINLSAGIGARHITVSTSGIVPGINQLAAANLPITLALSLHAPDSTTRMEIVPITSKYSIHAVMDAVMDYYNTTRRRVTIEYVMLEGVNDSDDQARHLAEMLKDLHCNINLIPFNPIRNKEGVIMYGRPDMKRQRRFADLAGRSGKTVTIRLERGTDIDAACGQLANKFLKAKSK